MEKITLEEIAFWITVLIFIILLIYLFVTGRAFK